MGISLRDLPNNKEELYRHTKEDMSKTIIYRYNNLSTTNIFKIKLLCVCVGEGGVRACACASVCKRAHIMYVLLNCLLKVLYSYLYVQIFTAMASQGHNV